MKNKNINERKIEIFSIAREMVMEEGLSSLTIRGLSERGDISIGSIYNLFGTKEKLILAIMEDYWNKVISELKSRSLDNGGDVIESLDMLYRYLKQSSDEFHKDWMRDFAESNISNTRIHPLIDEYREEVRLVLEDILLADPRLAKSFDEDFTSYDFSNLLLSRILLMLSDGEEDLGFLKIVLEKMFYLN